MLMGISDGEAGMPSHRQTPISRSPANTAPAQTVTKTHNAIREIRPPTYKPEVHQNVC